MDKEMALDILNRLSQISKIVQETNRKYDDYTVFLGTIIVEDLEEIANTLQLTRSYWVSEDSERTYVSIVYEGLRLSKCVS